MGIIKQELAVFELSDGRDCRIENNVGEEIHIHVGKVRLDMSIEEFEEFAETVIDGQKQLQKVKEWE